ncbi:ABC-2 type transport system permease protein [Bacillus sp. RC55]|uniref:ABC transporter permease n=1 Tax=Bacillus TaxID=1386 RepID=UPI0018F7804E|nr:MULTISPECIES: ABC transporter permease [Bacillus cereus group]MBJ8019857.1 ABC transporter permease [Bacillus cereus group sp. N34]QWI61284.1 ABC transporter permease [Bacillus mycoides]
MKALVISEWERLWNQKKSKWMLGIFTVIVFLQAWFLKYYGVGIYNDGQQVPLNSWNFSWFLLKESSFLITLIFMPVCFLNSLNVEYNSGAYRLFLIRPFQRLTFLMSKWFSLSVMVLLYLFVVLFIGIVLGLVFFKADDAFTFYGQQKTSIEAIFYTVQVYGLFFIIQMCGLAIASLISIIISNAVISFFLLIGIYIGSLYISQLSFFLLSVQSIFHALSTGSNSLYVLILGIMIISVSVCISIWNKKEFTC